MLLRTQASRIVCLVVVGVTLPLLLGANLAMARSYQRMEDAEALESAGRVQSAIALQIEEIDSKVQDYAHWDDSWHFLADGNQTFIDSNISDTWLKDLRLDVGFFVSADGTLLLERTVPGLFPATTAGGTSLPPELRTLIATGDPRVLPSAVEGGGGGVIATAQGPLLLAVRPGLNSKSEGPVHGVIGFGRLLTGTTLERLAFLTRVRLEPLGQDHLVERPELRLIDRQTIAVDQPLTTLAGRPCGIRMLDDRQITIDGQRQVLFLGLAIACGGMGVGGVLLVVLRRRVLARLAVMAAAVESAAIQAGRGTDPSRLLVPLDRPDELGQVAEAVNHLLESLARNNRDLARARDEALAGARAKDEFLAVVSHEMRTPLTGVMGMAGLLMDTPLDGDQRDFVQTMRESGGGLLQLINDILDYSKMDAGRIELEQIPFDPREIVDEVVFLLAGRAQAKGLEIACVAGPHLPGRLLGDPSRLRQLLLNIVSNAVKFTEQGEVEVSIDGEPVAADGRSTLLIAVRDTGIGIPPEVLPRLFTAFTQADSSHARRYGGTGLGLAICRRISEAMGGRIEVESEPGLGSTFFITLPFEPATTSTEVPIALPSLAHQVVLVVDRSPAFRRQASADLGAAGARVVAVAEPAEARGVLATARFAALLIDAGPDGVGITTGSALVAGTSQTPPALVLLTRQDQRRDLADPAKSAGFLALLGKPVRQGQLAALVATVATSSGSTSSGLVSAYALALRRGGHFRALLIHPSGGDQQVLVGLLEQLGCPCDVAGDGAEGLHAWDRGHHELVLLAMELGQRDGLEVAHALRSKAMATGRRLVLVGLMDPASGRGTAVDIDEQLVRPVGQVDLEVLIARWFPGAITTGGVQLGPTPATGTRPIPSRT